MLFRRMYYLILILYVFFISIPYVQSNSSIEKIPDNFTGTWEEYYKNGNKLIETQYTNGEKNGLSIQWYPSGCPMSIHHFKYNKLNGPAIKWEDCNEIIAIGEYKNSQPWNGYFLINPSTAVPITDTTVFVSDLTYYVLKFDNGLPFSGLSKKALDKFLSSNPAYKKWTSIENKRKP